MKMADSPLKQFLAVLIVTTRAYVRYVRGREDSIGTVWEFNHVEIAEEVVDVRLVAVKATQSKVLLLSTV